MDSSGKCSPDLEVRETAGREEPVSVCQLVFLLVRLRLEVVFEAVDNISTIMRSRVSKI